MALDNPELAGPYLNGDQRTGHDGTTWLTASDRYQYAEQIFAVTFEDARSMSAG